MRPGSQGAPADEVNLVRGGRMRRIERLINLIAALLETPRPLTAEDIRDQVAGYDQPNHEAFRRAFERDKEALRSMGIPVEVVPSSQDPFAADVLDGYLIPKERYYLPQIDLEPEELAALRLAADAVLGGAEEGRAGLLKMSMGTPSASIGAPRTAWGADVSAEQPLLVPLYVALLERSPVRFSYRAASGEESERRVSIYALLHRRGNWYVVGWDETRSDVRSFKVSRICSSIDPLEGSYEVPHGFDAGQHLSKEAYEIGGDPGAEARVRFSPSLAWWAEQNLSKAERRELDSGALEITLPAANPEALVSWVLGFAGEVELIGPQEVREALRDHLAPVMHLAETGSV